MNAREYYYQVDNVEYIKNKLGTEQWIQVCGHRTINGADAGFWCGLVDDKHIPEVMGQCSWEIGSDTSAYPGFEEFQGEITYKKCSLDDGYEPILFYREFYGVYPDYVEVSQEFILLNNLYFDSKKRSYYAVHDSGDSEEVIRFEDERTILIKSTYLFRYSAAKQKCFVIFYDIRAHLDGTLSERGFERYDTEYSEGNIRYGLWGNELPAVTKNKIYSVLMGKKLFPPMSIEKCGYWPFESARKYEDFIIGISPEGEQITHTCNPDKLNNLYDSNPDEPSYFTPVFFRKEVLQKYISKPELYEITDGYLTCGSLWSIEIDNHHKDVISVFLGDIGTYLPEEEQPLWKFHNIVSEEKISEVTYKRDFLCMPVPSNMEDHIFQMNYIRLNGLWREQFGWDFFLPLSAPDEYNLGSIRIPMFNSQQEFDNLVLSLVKVLIDSLNEKELIKQVNVLGNIQAQLKGIGKLEAWLNSKQVADYEEHIKFLRDLQELRSAGTGHRKGKSYEKISAVFQLEEKTYADVFIDILQKANRFLVYMENTFLEDTDL